MVSLLQLKEYAEQTNESNALKIINDYIKTTDENASVVMKTGTYNLTIDEFVNQTKKIPKMIKIDTDGKELKY